MFHYSINMKKKKNTNKSGKRSISKKSKKTIPSKRKANKKTKKIVPLKKKPHNKPKEIIEIAGNVSRHADRLFNIGDHEMAKIAQALSLLILKSNNIFLAKNLKTAFVDALKKRYSSFGHHHPSGHHHGSSGSYGSYGSSGSYGSYGSYGSSGSYGGEY